MIEDNDDFDDFIRSHMDEIAAKIGGSSGKRMAELTEQRRKVNNKALEIINEKGYNLVASLFHEHAKENETVAAIIDMGWTVGDFDGITSLLNRLSEMQVVSGNLTTATMLRAFALAVSAVGVQAVGEYHELDELIHDIYNLELEYPSEDEWDIAHTALALEEAEGEVWWEKVKNALKHVEEEDEQEDQDG